MNTEKKQEEMTVDEMLEIILFAMSNCDNSITDGCFSSCTFSSENNKSGITLCGINAMAKYPVEFKEACIKYRDKFMRNKAEPKNFAWKYLCVLCDENHIVCCKAYVKSEDEAIEWCERNVVADCHTLYRKVCMEC